MNPRPYDVTPPSPMCQCATSTVCVRPASEPLIASPTRRRADRFAVFAATRLSECLQFFESRPAKKQVCRQDVEGFKLPTDNVEDPLQISKNARRKLIDEKQTAGL